MFPHALVLLDEIQRKATRTYACIHTYNDMFPRALI